MNSTKKFRARERFKQEQYRLADKRAEKLGLGRACVLCRAGIPGGTQIATTHHEILPKSELPGFRNWKVLFAQENIAPACSLHHTQLQHLRGLWMRAMVTTGLARSEQYQVAPFKNYWSGEDYPPTAQCLGNFGYGFAYFQLEKMPSSLARLYILRNPDFDASRFCDFCRQKAICEVLTEDKAEESAGLVLSIPTPELTWA